MRILGLLALYALPVQAQTPATGWVVDSICPGEYCQYGPWTACDTVPLHQLPAADAPVVGHLGRGEVVQVPTGRIVAQPPGIARALRPLRLDADRLNTADVTQVTLAAGDTIYLLADLGEDYWVISIRGEQVGHPTFWVAAPDTVMAAAVLLRPAVAEWWVTIRRPGFPDTWATASWPRFAGMAPHMELGMGCPAT